MKSRPGARLTPGRRALLDRLLDHMLELDEPARTEQMATLARRCRRLHDRLDRLLTASTTPTQFLSQAIAGTARRALAEHEPQALELPVGTRLGAWRIIGPAGQGGMGVVYQAERADGAFDMQAAVKLIRTLRPGLSERLLFERQMLARLDHAGISRLIDGGLTDDGHAYLVMEWVPGTDLTCTPREQIEALDIFGQIADAISHAHQRMIIHGDIKPANIRIMPDGRARLLDFGVARLLQGDEGNNDDGVRALTPTYAAPELLKGQAASAQSDIWALGTVLFWLLTGRNPSADQPVSAKEIRHARSHELAAIIDKARAADPDLRYSSVAELGEDVQRIQQHQPVRALPAGPMKQLMLWGRRNPTGAVLAGLMGLGLLVGTSLLAWQAQIVTAERDLARFENTRWEIMRDHLVMLFQEVARETNKGEALGARELLDGSADLLDRFMADDPAGKRQIKSMLGELYIALQDYTSAAEILRAFVADDDGSTTPALRIQAYANLAQSEERLGNHAEALAMVDQTIAMVGPLPGDHRQRLSELHQIRGRTLRSTGRWPEAIEALETGLNLARSISTEPHRTLGFAQNNLGVTLLYAGRPIQAMTHFSDSLATWRALGLEESNDALNVMGNLASLKHQQGNLLEAEDLYLEVIDLRQRRYGGSAALAAVHNNYGLLLLIRNRPEEAGQHFARALELQARFVGEQSPDYALSLRSRGMQKKILGDLTAADQDFVIAEGIMLERVGPDHLFSVLIRAHRANLERLTQPLSAGATLATVIADFERIGAPAEPQLAAALCEKALLKLDLGQPEKALPLARRCAEIRSQRLIEGSWQTREALALIAAAEIQLDEPEAEQRLIELVGELATSYGRGHPRLAWFEQVLADLH